MKRLKIAEAQAAARTSSAIRGCSWSGPISAGAAGGNAGFATDDIFGFVDPKDVDPSVWFCCCFLVVQLGSNLAACAKGASGKTGRGEDWGRCLRKSPKKIKIVVLSGLAPLIKDEREINPN
jgi:hypothetical protein